MSDPELKEDRTLQPYQGELFPVDSKRPKKYFIEYKTRGQVRGRSHTPLDSIKKPDWLKKPSGKIEIVYN